jgi:hypothetical protein
MCFDVVAGRKMELRQQAMNDPMVATNRCPRTGELARFFAPGAAAGVRQGLFNGEIRYRGAG